MNENNVNKNAILSNEEIKENYKNDPISEAMDAIPYCQGCSKPVRPFECLCANCMTKEQIIGKIATLMDISLNTLENLSLEEVLKLISMKWKYIEQENKILTNNRTKYQELIKQARYNEIKVYVEACREGVQLPEYAHDFDAGMDIRSAEDIIVHSGQTVIIPTGLKVAIPQGYEIQVRPRSGISLKTPLRISNSPGTIDTNYRDEIGIIVTNTSNISGDYDELNGAKILSFDEYKNPIYAHTLNTKNNLKGTYLIQKGDRIAQLVLQKVPRIQWNQIDDITKIEGNRGGGFGSSGI